MSVSDGSAAAHFRGGRARLARERVRVATALTFLTRLPVSRLASAEASELALATRWFPLVGAIVGLLLGVCLWCLAAVFPDSIAVALTLVLSVLLTGAFHEDGLADVADSAGAFGVEAKLAIMRDSRVGTYGAMALILSTLLRFTLLWELQQRAPGLVLSGLVAAHVLSRWASVGLMATVPYARPEAANKVVAEGVTPRLHRQTGVVTLLMLLLPAVVAGPAMVALLVPAWLMVQLLAAAFRRSFGGITGDCLGAANQLVELTVLLTLVAAVSLA